MDLEKEAKENKNACRVDLVEDDLKNICKYEDKFFDIIYSEACPVKKISVFRNELISKIHRLLKVNGLFIIIRNEDGMNIEGVTYEDYIQVIEQYGFTHLLDYTDLICFRKL